MKTSASLVLALLAIGCIATPSIALKSKRSAFDKCVQNAQEEYAQGDFRKAQDYWEKSLGEVASSGASDEHLATALKRLGETLLKLGKYSEAETCFTHAETLFESLGKRDPELRTDVDNLAQAYRSVNIDNLGQFAEELTKEAHVLSIGFVQTDTGQRVEIHLARPFEKQIKNPFVKEVELGRHIRFEISQQPDGSINISDIRGLEIRGKRWVKVTDLAFKENQEGLHIADISGKRMGITRTVSAKLSGRMYAIISAVANQIKVRPTTPRPIAESHNHKTQEKTLDKIQEKTEDKNSETGRQEPNTNLTAPASPSNESTTKNAP